MDTHYNNGRKEGREERKDFPFNQSPHMQQCKRMMETQIFLLPMVPKVCGVSMALCLVRMQASSS